MTTKTIITHHPLVVNEEPMKNETALALERLWEVHPHNMFLRSKFRQSDTYVGSISDVTVGFYNDKYHADIPFHEAKGILEALPDGQKILRNAVFEVLADSWIQHLAENTMDFMAPNSNQNEFRQVIFLPNLIHVCGERPERLLTFIRDRSEPGHPATHELHDLGYFIAGEYQSSHDKMEIQSRINRFRQGWAGFSESLLRTQHYNRYASIEYCFDFGEPIFERNSV